MYISINLYKCVHLGPSSALPLKPLETGDKAPSWCEGSTGQEAEWGGVVCGHCWPRLHGACEERRLRCMKAWMRYAVPPTLVCFG